MAGSVHYAACPVCNSRDINPLLTAKDHTVSQSDFVIWQCSACSLRFTQDVPDEYTIGAYYQSADYISHSDTNKGLVNKMYMFVRKRTLRSKAALIESHSAKNRGVLLDMGAGTGAFLNEMQQRGWEVTGMEPDESARKKARELYGLELRSAAEFQASQSNHFDVITLWHVLEHVHALHEYMDNLKEWLKRDGKLFIAVPNYQSLDADVYRDSWAAYDVPRHLYHFSPQSMEKLLQMHGFRLVKKKQMWFDAFYISLLSSRYRKGSVNYPVAFFQGLRSNLNAISNPDHCSSLIYIAEKN